jgi:hypothetical protein
MVEVIRMTTYFRIDQPGKIVGNYIQRGTHGINLNNKKPDFLLEYWLNDQRLNLNSSAPDRRNCAYAFLTLDVARNHIDYTKLFQIYEVKKVDENANSFIGSYTLITQMLLWNNVPQLSSMAENYWNPRFQFGESEILVDCDFEIVALHDGNNGILPNIPFLK